MDRVYLLLGTNLGEKEQNLRCAISLLVTQMAPFLFSEITESSVYETLPWGFESKDSFLNQAISFETTLDPEQILKICKWVEEKMGREILEPEYDSEGKRVYHSRIIDIDILLFGDRVVDLPHLQIPHPDLYNREFALNPLNEIKKV